MITVVFEVNKANVYDEVAKTTSYIGVKMKEDANAYGRFFTTDEDRIMLERFWVETCNAVTDEFKPFVINVSNQPQSHGLELDRNYKIELELSNNFDETLQGGIETSLYSFFVNSIIAKWCKFTNKDESASYVSDAAAAMIDVRKKVYYRMKPKRMKI